MTSPIMSKHFDDPLQVNRLNEDIFFRVYQRELLDMANTDFGKELLCIPKDYKLPIVRIAKNEITQYVGPKNGEHEFIATYFIGAKFANVIRYRWPQFQSYFRYFVNKDYGVPLSPMTRYARSVMALELIAYPDPHTETTTVDGRVAYADTGTWATVHDALTGTDAFDATTPLLCINSHNGTDYAIHRIFTLFATSSLTSSASISAGTVELYVTSRVNTSNDGRDYVTIVTSNPASNTALATADYDQCGDAISNPTKNSDDVDITGITLNAYNVWTLNATGRGNISKTAITKFGQRHGNDIENVAIPNSTNNRIDYSGAETTGTSEDPKLTVTYTLATARARLTLLGVA